MTACDVVRLFSSGRELECNQAEALWLKVLSETSHLSGDERAYIMAVKLHRELVKLR